MECSAEWKHVNAKNRFANQMCVYRMVTCKTLCCSACHLRLGTVTTYFLKFIVNFFTLDALPQSIQSTKLNRVVRKHWTIWSGCEKLHGFQTKALYLFQFPKRMSTHKLLIPLILWKWPFRKRAYFVKIVNNFELWTTKSISNWILRMCENWVSKRSPLVWMKAICMCVGVFMDAHDSIAHHLLGWLLCISAASDFNFHNSHG